MDYIPQAAAKMEHSFNTLLAGTRDRQGHAVMRSQMDHLREQQQSITILKQVAMQPQNWTDASPAANVPLPHFLEDVHVALGSKNQVQAENSNTLHKNSSDSETDCKTLMRSHLIDVLALLK